MLGFTFPALPEHMIAAALITCGIVFHFLLRDEGDAVSMAGFTLFGAFAPPLPAARATYAAKRIAGLCKMWRRCSSCYYFGRHASMMIIIRIQRSNTQRFDDTIVQISHQVLLKMMLHTRRRHFRDASATLLRTIARRDC